MVKSMFGGRVLRVAFMEGEGEPLTKRGNEELDVELLVLMKQSLGKLNKWNQMA